MQNHNFRINSNYIKKYYAYIVAAFFSAICGIFALFQPLYTQVDNYIVSLVLNRCFDSDVYCLFLNPLLCWGCGAIQKLIPYADVYTLVSRIMILLGIFFICCLITKNVRHIWELICVYGILFLLVINSSLFFDYYTIWAAFFSFVGMTYFLLTIRIKPTVKQTIIGLVFMAAGMMWRIESAILFVPFYLLDLAFMFGEQAGVLGRKKCITKIFKVMGGAFLCMVILITVDYSVKHSEKYEEGVEYEAALSDLVDFPMKEYIEVSDLLPGISENDYYSLQVRLLADTDRIDAKYGEKILSVSRENSFSWDIKSIKDANVQLLKMIWTSKKTLLYSVMLAIIFLIVVISAVKWYRKVELFFAYAGAYIIMLYFSIVGRIPLRVINSVLYAVWGIVLVMFCLEEWKSDRKFHKWIKTGLLALVMGIALLDTINYDFVSPQSVFMAQNDADEKKWESTYQDDEIYLWQTNEFVQRPIRNFMDQGKLLSEDFLDHNLCYGEWTWGQVYYKNYLDRLGIPNPMRALVERQGTYLVAEDNILVLTYLQEHYDESVYASQIDEIEGIPVWKFQIL